MNSARRILGLCYFLWLVALLILLEWLRGLNVDFPAFTSLREGVIVLVLSPQGDAVLAGGLGLWFFALLWVDVRGRADFPERSFWRGLTTADCCKALLAIGSLGIYAVCWSLGAMTGDRHSLTLGIDQSTNILVFLGGLVVSEVVAIIQNRADDGGDWFRQRVLVFLVIFFAATSLVHVTVPFEYKYRTASRWTSLWFNPNIYGLLMGVGIALAAGLLIRILISKQWCDGSLDTVASHAKRWKVFSLFILLTAAVVMSLGLIKSYSRGAWVATASGLAYLLIAPHWPQASAHLFWVRRNGLSLAIIILATGTLLFWHFRDTQETVARRVFSVANAKDFSWRNRLSAWEGSLQMISERPWFGFGWNQTEPMYEQYYRPPQVPDGLAIEMNDYLMLGTTLGIPMLASFVVLLWTTLRAATAGTGENTHAPPRWLFEICRAGVIALLVGFWFDGGLFKLATATPFWLLLELSRPQLAPVAATPEQEVA